MIGNNKDQIAETGTFIWVDVRDLALCHVKAMEVEGAKNKRFFITAGYFSNKEVANIIRKDYPQLKNLPTESTPGGDYPKDGIYKYNNSRTIETLGIKFRPLEQTITDTVKSLQALSG